MGKNKFVHSQSGFTLVEIIAVLVILSVLASVAIPRFFDLEANANERALDAAIGELNGRENMIWAQLKISEGGYDPLTGAPTPITPGQRREAGIDVVPEDADRAVPGNAPRHTVIADERRS